MPGAKYDFDFANNRYWGGSIQSANGAATNMNTFLGATTSGAVANSILAPDIFGVYHGFPQYGLRITQGCGLWTESLTTNYALWCRDFTNAVWTAVNVTATKNQTGVDLGANAACTLTAGAIGGTILQTITHASNTFISSCLIKRLSGTGTISITSDGINYTDVTSQINSGTWTQASGSTVTQANPVIGIKFGASGDSIAVDCFQTENNTYATNPMITTSAINFRGPEEPTFNTTGTANNAGHAVLNDIFVGTPMSCVAILSGNKGGTQLITGNDNAQVLASINATELLFNSATSSNTPNSGINTLNKAALRMGYNLSSCCLNGGAIATNAQGFNYAASGHGSIGNIGAGTNALDGYCSRISYWNKEITDGQMIAWTR